MRSKAQILGIPVDPYTRKELLEIVTEALSNDQQLTVAYANVHVLDQSGINKDLADFLRAVEICYCDGKGVQLAAKILGAHLPERITGADWIWDLAELSEGRYRICWLSGDPGTTDEASEVLKAKYPGLDLIPMHGFHDKEGPGNDWVIDRINSLDAQILLVGFGTPLQERWVAANREKLRVPIVWCLGATADFISGRVSRGPEWLYSRQEWLARFAVDPKKLWHRYLIGNTRVLARVLVQRAKNELA